MARGRLKKGDIDIDTILMLSYQYYQQDAGDDKKRRAQMDLIDGKIIARNNFSYDRSQKAWIQTGREVKFVFLVKSDPISYKREDTVKIHRFPVTFLLRDISMGMESAFRWRTGSLRMPKFNKKGMTKQQRIKIANGNINNGIQMQFFFELEAVLARWGLLFGRNRTNRLPRFTNPQLIPFFDKHALICVEECLMPIFTNPKGKAAIGKIFSY